MPYARWTGAAVAAATLAMGAQSASAAPTVTALTDGNSLLTVSADRPNKVLATTAITGLAPGESITGIDRRPATGALYAVVSSPMTQAKVVLINADGSFSNVQPLVVANPGPPVTPTTTPIVLSGSSFDLDFNPTVDRLRLVSDAGENLRINVSNGATLVDKPLNPGTPEVVGAAYTNNDNDSITAEAGATGTTLYDIDTATDTLAMQAPPNDGTLAAPKPLGVPVGGPVGFDIYSDVVASPALPGRLKADTNVPYASFAESGGTEKLYTVDLATGAATEVGPFARKDIADIAVAIDTTP